MLCGLIDDIKHVRPVIRLMIQAGAAAMLLYGEIGREATLFLLGPLQSSLPEWASSERFVMATGGAFCFFVLAGATNSTNLIDGLDGLCAGIVGIASLGFLLLNAFMGPTAGVEGADLALRAVVCAAVLGACVGFLRYNFNPASMFMGDSGSLLLGFNVAVVLIMFAEEPSWRWFACGLIIFAFPIFDTALAIARRWLRGHPLFTGDRSHFYDQLRDRGLTVRTTVLLCYGMGLAFAALGFVMLRLPLAWLIAVLVAVPVVFAVGCWKLGMLRVDDAAARSESLPDAPDST
jgi:UDP-GlcNAc:undecaprenyl-phosphate GlcNAc-1-phosphate transferase